MQWGKQTYIRVHLYEQGNVHCKVAMGPDPGVKKLGINGSSKAYQCIKKAKKN